MDFYERITNALTNLEEAELIAAVSQFCAASPSHEQGEQAISACQAGMAQVGTLFEQGEYFVGDLIYAADILQGAMEQIKPVLGGGSSKKVAKLVLGSAPGDLHDIGKNIFKSMMDVAGFEVVDLGVDVAPEKWVEAVVAEKPQVVGISGLLTMSLDSMKDVIDALSAAGLRDRVKVMIGGSPVNDAIQARVGADANSNNASGGVRQCLSWVQ